MNEKIYILLLDEGTEVWRPAPARRLDDGAYLILQPDDYDPVGEHWQFPPGSIVVCEQRSSSEGPIFAAVRLKQDARRTA